MILAFSGKSKAGKTTAANYLQVNYGFRKLSFADRLKELAKEFYPFNTIESHGELKDKPYKKYDWTPRDFLIRLGHFVRFHDPEYFINYISNLPTSTNWVIDDLRFKNEAKNLKEMGATLIRLERYKKYLNNIVDSSETELDDYDKFDFKVHEVQNTDIKTLHKQLDIIMSELGYAKR